MDRYGDCVEAYYDISDSEKEYEFYKECSTGCDNTGGCNSDNKVEELFYVYNEGVTYPRYHYCYQYSSENDPEYQAHSLKRKCNNYC